MADMNAAKKFIYIAPSPPVELIDSTSFTIDFAGRKFLYVGLDPVQHHAIIILIITLARHILITTEFLQSIYHMIGDLLSYLLDAPTYKRKIFLCTDTTTLSSMVFKDENVLILESKTQDGCRIILNHRNLMRLINLEQSIH
ncbi:Hypothetical protein CINCED_3A003850 [Cinara cedri]|uniref:Uncharacterized protein n=1 Tax=Cinara cedri TaxID=506608 RepID=A0A5E4NI26_9HEMI|nr:Hypothetical protein CINCED_3A003850 [Cinara cedri]